MNFYFEDGDDSMVYRCPSHLTRGLSSRYLAVHTDKCYMFVKDEKHWNDANHYCQNHGGQLITITRKDIQHFVEGVLAKIWHNNGLWIGAHDRDREMDWYWVTGEKLWSGSLNYVLN